MSAFASLGSFSARFSELVGMSPDGLPPRRRGGSRAAGAAVPRAGVAATEQEWRSAQRAPGLGSGP